MKDLDFTTLFREDVIPSFLDSIYGVTSRRVVSNSSTMSPYEEYNTSGVTVINRFVLGGVGCDAYEVENDIKLQIQKNCELAIIFAGLNTNPNDFQFGPDTITVRNYKVLSIPTELKSRSYYNSFDDEITDLLFISGNFNIKINPGPHFVMPVNALSFLSSRTGVVGEKLVGIGVLDANQVLVEVIN